MRLTILVLLAVAGFFTFTAPAHAAPLVPPWGLHLEYIDRSVRPGDDFYAYANGLWLKTAVIPADRSGAGGGLEVGLRNDERLRTIVGELKTRTDLVPEEVKLRDLYDAFTNEARIEAAGLKPLEKDLAEIAALRTHDDVAREMALPALHLRGPFEFVIGVDDKNPNSYIVQIEQSGLGLPDRDYYLRDDKALAETRAAYKKYLAQTLASVGVANPGPRATAVFALEHDLAVAHWPAVDTGDADKTYNPMTIPELKSLAPGFPWDASFSGAGISLKARGADRGVLAREKSAFPRMAKVFAATPVSVWRDYLTVRCVHAFATCLPRRFDDADFAFFGTTLGGRSKQLDRATRGVRFLDGRMGEALGKFYAAKYFPPESKAKVRTLVDNLIKAFDENLNTLDWMTDVTRAKAREKLHLLTIKVGYPDLWRDYSALAIDRGNIVEDLKSANTFEWRHDLDRIDGPVDKTEWGMSPPTINAYYDENANEIVFPAGILQSPWFDADADDAVNYASIGGTIGHEIGHAFDDQGSKYDGTGMMRNWWTDADRKNFDERTAALAKQYDEYEPLPGLHINGTLTLGENIGDLSGLAIAHKAYRISLGGKEAPVLDGLTGDQRFFLSYGQSWRSKARDEVTRQRLVSNPHSPPSYRVVGVLRNLDEWYKAFPEISAKDKYYLAPEKRVRLW